MEIQLDWKWRRKILRIKDTLYVSIPFPYVEASGLKPGQYLEVRIEDDGSLNVSKEANVANE